MSRADDYGVLGRRRYRQWRREAKALCAAKSAVLDQHGADIPPEAREAAHREISIPALGELYSRHLADAMVDRFFAEMLSHGEHVRVETLGGVRLVPKAKVSAQHRAMIHKARLRRRLARARQREARR